MTIIALILALGLFINCQKIDINKETYAPTMNLATAEEIGLAATTIGLEHGTINPETNVTNDNLILTTKIALAHLNEFPNYYNSRYGLTMFEKFLKEKMNEK